jgi:threonine dehydratase
MNDSWNITLFHYRNHGSDVGRVLAGIQVLTGDQRQFADFLRQIADAGYSWVEETDNVAYKLFLGLKSG